MSALTLRLSDAEHRRLKLASVYNGRSVTDLVRDVLPMIPDGLGGATCPARIEGPFLSSDATYAVCGQGRGHDGPHIVSMRWADPETKDSETSS